MKVFLTGGTGFIGRPLASRLLGRGWGVTALVRDPDAGPARALARRGVTLAAGDVLEPASMIVPMGGADIVVHNAGVYEYGLRRAGRRRMMKVNVRGTDNVLGLAHRLGVPRTVYVSSIQAFGDAGGRLRDETFARQSPCRTAYERSKSEAHVVAVGHWERGLPLVIVCPDGVVGANDHSPIGYFQRLYLNRLMPPLAWAPRAMTACVDVEDVAEGIVLGAERGRLGETYILCGEARTMREALLCWSSKPGGFTPRVWLPAALAAVLLAPAAPVLRMLGLPAFISRDAVLGLGTDWNYSAEKARRELGWAPRRADELWDHVFAGEAELRSKRRGQTWVRRLRPLELDE